MNHAVDPNWTLRRFLALVRRNSITLGAVSDTHTSSSRLSKGPGDAEDEEERFLGRWWWRRALPKFSTKSQLKKTSFCRDRQCSAMQQRDRMSSSSTYSRCSKVRSPPLASSS